MTQIRITCRNMSTPQLTTLHFLPYKMDNNGDVLISSILKSALIYRSTLVHTHKADKKPKSQLRKISWRYKLFYNEVRTNILPKEFVLTRINFSVVSWICFRSFVDCMDTWTYWRTIPLVVRSCQNLSVIVWMLHSFDIDHDDTITAYPSYFLAFTGNW